MNWVQMVLSVTEVMSGRKVEDVITSLVNVMHLHLECVQMYAKVVGS